jgi:hypothetical protein
VEATTILGESAIIIIVCETDRVRTDNEDMHTQQVFSATLELELLTACGNYYYYYYYYYYWRLLLTRHINNKELN